MKRYAIFFPQFYPIPVNDSAWGDGFTDWVLVAAANAFKYWNRRCPRDGFYDLSRESDIQKQFELASRSGLDGFAIYHYRFDDGPELDAVERYLRSHVLPSRFKYFFVWANESWSKRWAGESTHILKYSLTAPDRSQIADHVSYLKCHMESESYTTFMGRPMFVLYRPESLKDVPATLNLYREAFETVGLRPSIGLFIKNSLDVQYSRHFDFGYLFEPRLFFNSNGIRKRRFVQKLYSEMLHIIPYEKIERLSEFVNKVVAGGPVRYSFADFLAYFASAERANLLKSLECPAQNVLTCGWNNAPRYRDRFTELAVPQPDEFSSMLRIALETRAFSPDLPLLCNAWNEWSEGAALEPCSYLGGRLLNNYLSDSESQ